MSEPVFIPLRPGSKEPAVRGWAAPEWRLDPDDVALDTQFGLRCDGLCVVDCDTVDAAKAWFDRFDPKYFVRTRNGYHFYYRMPAGERFGPIVGLFDKIDLRAGPGSYVLAPGAKHPEGGHYVPNWGAALSLDKVLDQLEVLPEQVADTVRARREKSSSPAGPAGDVAEWDKVPVGHRNDVLAAVAGMLRKKGASESAIGMALFGVNKLVMDDPLDTEELKTIARSVGRYQPEGFDLTVEIDEGMDLIDARTVPEPPARTWLWKPYIPDTTMTLIAGREKVGKGLFCAKLAVGVASGELPDGSSCTPRPVLWISFEDDYRLDIIPRLKALGYSKDHEAINFWPPKDRVVLPRQMVRYLERMGEHGLVIIDPGRSVFLDPEKPEFSFNNEADVRPALQELLWASAELEIPQLFVAHQRKSFGEGGVADTTSGTIAWRQVPRHIIDLVKIHGESAMAVTSSNHFRSGFVREYSIEAHDDDHPYFVLGDERPDFPELDDWIKARREGGNVEITEDDAFAAVTEAAQGELQAGDRFWQRPLICERFGVSQKEARQLLTQLRDAGMIEERKGRGNVWVG